MAPEVDIASHLHTFPGVIGMIPFGKDPWLHFT